jgi:hypothetical protein
MPKVNFSWKASWIRGQARLATLSGYAILAGFDDGKTMASVAQLAEQLICNQQVVGSSPSAGSRRSAGGSLSVQAIT